jgi:phage tail-like protein
MAAGDRKDPITTFLWGLKIDALSLDYEDGTALFKSCSGLSRQTDVQDFQEGGLTTATRKIIGVTKWPNLVLKNGFTGPPFSLWTWKDLMGKSGDMGRVDGSIFALGANFEVLAQWNFTNGYPVKWEGPEFDATKNELAIESLEIAHEGLSMGQPAPPAPPPPPPAPPISATVHFDFDKHPTPTPPNAELDAIVQELKDNPKKKVKVEGHTDSVGDHGYNVNLSNQRAQAVKQYLIDQGTDPAQIASTTGYGPDRPIASNATADGRAQNRRTTVTDA